MSAASDGASASLTSLLRVDPQMAQAIADEERRQQETIELIASENYVSRAVLQAQGSVLTNKYAEGYPGKRWYGGCHAVDVTESLAIERAKALFGAEHANVQPHAGAQANMAAYMAVLRPGDTVLAMDLAHGGHLTHGHKANVSSRDYHFVHYGVSRETEQLDYEALEAQANDVRPKLLLAGASAYPRLLDFVRLRAIADRAGALLMVDMAHIAGLVAAGVHPSPVPHAQLVTSTTHKTLRGPRGGLILCTREYAKQVDRAVFPGTQGGPLEHVIAAKGVALHEAMQPAFVIYQRQVVANAQALASELMRLGLRLVSGGTDNHLILADVGAWGLEGRVAADALEEAGVAVNKNTIPFDTRPPMVASGIRLGTPAVTTRGMGVGEMRALAGMITEVLRHLGDAEVIARVREQTREMCGRFPIPA